MARGGIHDHLGGGFHRYSTDAAWHIPHFEKMLYDQAQLAVAYTEAYQITRIAALADVARHTLDYVLRDMRGADGGFLSAEDADSPAGPAASRPTEARSTSGRRTRSAPLSAESSPRCSRFITAWSRPGTCRPGRTFRAS